MAPPRGRKSSKVERRASRPRAVHKREKKRVYADDWDDLDEADVALPRAYSLDQKLSCDRFTSEAVIELNGNEFNLEWVQRHGLSSPLLFRSTEGLGMKVPRADFTIDDVRTCVGSRRLLDVMDVNTQKNTQMTMKQWQRYYDSPSKDRLLNVISLEFSHTKLEKHVVAPTVVRQLDWVDCVWPRELKQLQTESTNALDEMMYPKVQKYCLMSVGGCFTDFHIDFGGTSVWYHVLRGKKYFWLIPPSEENIRMYEKWVLSGKQADIFFGDLVTQCSLVCLTSGHTFFIPTGWIHAVYTPEDSLVFGGNFLHSFGIETQIRVYKMEDITKVELKYRYPFFVEMLWYTLQRYVQCCLGSCQLSLALHELPELAEFEQLFQQQQQHHLQLLRKHRKHVHLTQFELRGIKAIVMFLHELPQCRKSVPSLIADPAALIGHVRDLVRLHRRDSPHRAVTGQPTLFWPDNGQAFVRLLRSLSKTASRNQSSVDTVVTESPVKPAAKHIPAETPVTDSPAKVFSTDPSSKTSDTSSRRVQCRKCAGCKADGCGSCDQCLDTNKLARHKQRCVKRVCTKPRLPASSVCALCGLSEQQPAPMPANVSSLHTSTPLGLFECHRCLVVSHMLCTFSQNPSLGCGLVDGTCPASWVCPACLMGSESSQSHRGRLLPQSDGGVSYSLLSKQLGCVDVSVTLPQLALEDALAAPKHRIEHAQPTETAAVTAGISQTEAETGAAVTAETATAITAETTTGISQTEAETGAAVTAETTTGMSQTKAETAAAVKVEIAAEVAGISQVEADTAARMSPTEAEMSPTEAETTADVPTQRMEMSQIEAENATEITAETVTQAELTTKAETAEMPSTEIETTPREAETAPTAADTTEAETAPTAADTTEAETAPTAAEITPTEATEAEADTTPTEAETAPTEADATEAEADTTPTETETAPTAAEITPTEAEATEAGSDTSQTEADTTPTEAGVTEADTTPTEAEATEAEADTTITEAAAETTPIEAEMAAEAKTSPTEAETTLIEAEMAAEAKASPTEAETTLRVLETTEAAAETSPFGAEIAAEAKASPTEAETTTESETAATEAETTPTEVETTPTELEPTMTESESVIETRYCAVAREAVEICEDRNEAEKMSVGCVSDSEFARSESDGVICPTGSTSGYSNGSNTNIADVIPHPADASGTMASIGDTIGSRSDVLCEASGRTDQSDDASSLQQSDEYSQPSCIHRQGQFNPDSPPFHQVSSSFCQVTDSPPREVNTSPPHEGSTASLHEVGSSSLFEVGISPPHEISSSPPRELSTFSLHEISSSPPREVSTSPLHEISSSPPREVTVSPPREVTVSHPREVNVSPPHEVISPPREVTVSPPHKVTACPPREVNVSPPREATVSPPHKVTASPPREVTVPPPRESICSRSPSPPVLQPNFYEQWLSGDECSLSSSSAVSAAAPQLSPMSPHTP